MKPISPDLTTLYATTSLYTPYENLQQRLRDHVNRTMGAEASLLGAMSINRDKPKAEKVWNDGGSGNNLAETRQKYEEAILNVGTYLHDKTGISVEEGEQKANDLALAMRDDYWKNFELGESLRRANKLPDGNPIKLSDRDCREARKVNDAISGLPGYLAIKALENVADPAMPATNTEMKTMRDFVGRVIYRSLISYGSIDPRSRGEPRVEPIIFAGDAPGMVVSTINSYYAGTVLPIAQSCLGKK